MFLAFYCTGQPNIVRTEYYVDIDPGYGNGIPVTITPGADGTGNFIVDFSSLNLGVHIVCVRSKDANGLWSLDNKFLFAKLSIAGAEVPPPNLSKTEYYVDTDPGYGNGIPVTITPGPDGTGNFIVDFTSLSLGAHIVCVRSKDANGLWSLDNKFLFAKLSIVGTETPPPNLSGTEYFVDTDPGYGNGIPVTITPGADGTGNFIIDFTSLSLGAHIVGVRSKDANGLWSLDNKFLFAKLSMGGTENPPPNLSGTEYFVDTDPGYGNGIPVSITPGANGTGNFIVDFTTLSLGAHVVCVRSKDANGLWSLDNKFIFAKLSSGAAENPPPNLSRTEFYIDIDPGYGNGIPVTITPGLTDLNTSFVADLTLVTSGPHLIIVRSKDVNGRWSLDDTFHITIPPGPLPCVDFITPPNGAAYVSPTGTLTWTSAAESPDGYKVYLGTDSLNLPLVSTQVDTFYNYSLSLTTKYFWRIVPYRGSDTASHCPQWSFTTRDNPPACAVITSPANTETNVPVNATLNWTVGNGSPTGYFVNIGTDSVNFSVYGTTNTSFQPNLNFNTTYYWQIVPYNGNGSAVGCPIRSFTTFVCTQPTITVTGPTNLCPGQTVTLTSSSGTSYLWNNGATSQSIVVNTGGVYYVAVDLGNGCNLGSFSVLISNDTRPQINSGNITSICEGDNLSLSYLPVASLLWSTGATTNPIIVQPSVTTTYGVQGVSAANCIYHDSIRIVVNPAVPPTAVSNLLPADGSVNLEIPFNISWLPGINNTKYDLFIWPADTDQPPLPSVTNITSINFTLNAFYVSPGITYKWQVVARNGNCFSTPGPIQTFATENLPDLIVDSLIIPAAVSSGNPISVSWEIKNNGSGSTRDKTWLDHIWLSADTILHDNPPATDFYLGGVPNLTSLSAGESYFNSATFTVPNGIGGNYHVIIKTNQLGTQAPVTSFTESNNLNNFKISDSLEIELSPSPDLQVTSIVTPINAFSGLTVNVSYTITNKGSDIINAAAIWYDNVYISFSPSFNPNTATLLALSPHGGILPHDSSYTSSTDIIIPNHIFGLYYIYVVTDQFDQLFEDPFETNNVSSDVINIYLTPPPDLAVQNFTAPVTASSGTVINLLWTVNNTGANATDNVWVDKIYLSPNGNYNLNNAVEIGSSSPGVLLNPGESYNGSSTAYIPPGYNGTYYLYVFTNATGSLFEFNNTLNNILRSDTTIIINSADLIVDTVVAPASGNSGQNIQVSWKIKNTGAGDVVNAVRVDSIYLSSQSSFNHATAHAIGGSGFTESLSAGASINKQTSIQLPNGISGNHYLYIMTDADTSIFENGSDANNITRSAEPINITLSPSADLVIQSKQLPDSARSGFKMPLSFTIQNAGNAAAMGTTWTDKVYISPYRTWDTVSHAMLLGTFTRTQSVGSNSTYTFNDSVLVEVSKKGELVVDDHLLDSAYAYLYIITDADKQVYENNGETNNISAVDSIYIIPPRIDLEVTRFTASDSAYSGQSAHAYWKVRNNGVSTAYKGPLVPDFWYDAIYISTDTIWDENDIFVFDWAYSDTPKDSSYHDGKDFIVPNGLSGDYYLIFVADHKYNLPEDVSRANNVELKRNQGSTGEARVFHISLSPSPDLNLTQATAAATGIAGQPLSVKWTGKNIGTGNTSGGGWEDGVFLSTDLLLDASDILLGSKAHIETISPGQTYDDSIQVTIPTAASGNYVLIIATDINDHVYEYQGENNNSKYSFINITVPLPADLIVTSVQPPATGLAGQAVSIDYTIKNTGIYPATGAMSDGIYLSRDSLWDIGDQLIGTNTGVINLAPNGQVVRNLTTQITGVSIGYYKVIVRTDLLNNIIETNDANNRKASIDSIYIDVRQLQLDSLTADTLQNNTYLYYRVEIPDSLAGETLLVTLTGDSLHASNEVYARFGNVPSRSVNDFSYGTLAGANQELLIPSLQGGTYYIAVYGNNSASLNQPITLKAEILPFAVRTVNSNTGGNTGSVTIELHGSRFEPNMQIRLDNGIGNVLVASTVHYVNSTKLFASFDLRSKPLGVYNVVAKKLDNSSATLINGFQVVTGTGGGFYISGTSTSAEPGCDPQATNGLNSLVQVSLQYPPVSRRNRVIAITIFFGNSGNVDLPVPTRFVFSKNGAPLSFTVLGLTENLQELSLEFRETNGPPNILRPGATGAITIYTKAVAPMNFILSD